MCAAETYTIVIVFGYPYVYMYILCQYDFIQIFANFRGGGGVHSDYFVKLYFEIAVDQQTRARDQTFEGVPDSGCPRDSHAHIWSICGPILPNDLNMLKTMGCCTCSYSSFHQNWIKIG